MSALRQRKGAPVASSKRQQGGSQAGGVDTGSAAATAAKVLQSEQRASRTSDTASAAQVHTQSSLASPKYSRLATSSGFCRTLLWSCLLIVQMALIIALLRPSAVRPVTYVLPSAPAFEGALEANEALARAERLFDGRLVGAESLAVHIGDDGKQRIYTGTADGKILRLDLDGSGTVSEFARLAPRDRCSAAVSAAAGLAGMERACGRPLGMRIKGSTLYAIDAYSGIYRLDLAAGSTTAEPQLLVGGGNVTFFNDLDVAANGTIYFTESSRRWTRSDFAVLALEGSADGRLMSYDAVNGLRVLLDGIAFANGVQLSPAEDYVLVVETLRCRVLRLFLRGPMRGRQDEFASNVPGVPDNLRLSPRGTYWVGLAAIRRRGMPGLFDATATRPWARYVLSSLLPPAWVTHLVPTKYGLVVELGSEGQIVSSLHDPSGSVVPSVSEAIELDGWLYLGSYGLPYMSRVWL